MIFFKSVTLENFVVFDRIKFDFKQGKTLVCGENGVGKSTLISESIITALFGRARVKDYRFDKNKTASVVIEFQKGDDAYTIERQYPDHDRRYPLITKNEEPLNFQRLVERENEIENILGVTREVFEKTLVIKQNEAMQFGALSPNLRKNLLEQLVGCSVWDKLRRPIMRELNAKKEQISQETLKLEHQKTEMLTLNARLETLKDFEDERELRLSKLQVQKDQIKVNIALLKKQIKSVEENTPRLSEVDIYQKNLAIMESELHKTKLDLNSKACGACERPFTDKNFPKIQTKIETLQPLVEETRTTLKDLTSIVNFLSKQKDKLRQLEEQLIYLENDEKRYYQKRNLAPMVTELNILTRKVNEAKAELEDKTDTCELTQYIDSLLKPSSEFRTYVLLKQIKTLEKLSNEIKKSIFPSISIELELSEKGVEYNITRDGQKLPYAVFSGGEKKRLDIIMIFAFQKYLSNHSGVQCNLIVLDEIFDSLDLKGINGILNTVDYLYPDASCLYVVSHKEELKQAFSGIVKLSKGEHGAFLESQDYDS